ncbi:hypothetical protein QYE76_021228 [Lolium multiflorum]|uniref:Transposase (putative) gypsy type domain-containing protein n=1 Tax=Lolium multiflorum TaxID=4521 RepID=A0AAD8VS10_LOLMU|nr:hypothetical protein QYE76_021228 [Lolium multiflorum]
MATEDLEWETSKISNQDMNLLKRLGFTKKKDALRFPHEESYPSPPMEYRVSFVDHLIRGLSPPILEFLRGLLFVYGLQLHQLTPNSILHVSIFITLCECFLGVQPNWALWKRIFCLRRNGSHGVAYNIGGVVICVRSDVDYFDVKFLISSKGGARGGCMCTKKARFNGSTRGKELSGIQITAYFLRIRVQPLQARKNPLWMYVGDEDVERLSTDLSAKDLEKLIRRISKLSKKDTVPSSCKVKPFCSANPLPEKSAASLENETEVTSSTRSSLPAASPKGKRKRDETIDSGASKADTSHAEKAAPTAGEKPLALYDAALISSYRDYAGKLEEKLAEANKRADALAAELEQSETARMEAEAKAAIVADLQKRLDDAKRALEENVAQHSAREEEILGRLESQSRRFVRRTHLENPEDDELLDALSLLEIHGTEARNRLAEAEAGLSRLFPYFFKKKEEGLQLRQEGLKVRDYLDFCTRTLSLVYGTMFPRNKMPETLPALMDKFRDAPRIHGFVRVQLAAGAMFAMIMIKIFYPKLDVGQVVPKCLAKMAKRKKNFSKYDDVVTPVAEDMMDELLRMDAEFFVKGSYAEHSTRAINNERLTIDNILGNP